MKANADNTSIKDELWHVCSCLLGSDDVCGLKKLDALSAKVIANASVISEI